MKFRIKINQKIYFAIFILATSICSCSNSNNTSDGVIEDKPYIVMEKVIADAPERPRTTLKIIVPNAETSNDVSASLDMALSDSRRDDPVLEAIVIWAYRERAELNSPSFTLGKLEWSSDGKDFAGRAQLDPNPKLHIIVK